MSTFLDVEVNLPQFFRGRVKFFAYWKFSGFQQFWPLCKNLWLWKFEKLVFTKVCACEISYLLHSKNFMLFLASFFSKGIGSRIFCKKIIISLILLLWPLFQPRKSLCRHNVWFWPNFPREYCVILSFAKVYAKIFANFFLAKFSAQESFCS